MLRRCLSMLAVVLGAMAVWGSQAVASTLTVNTTLDDTNPHDGLCSLRDAIEAVDSPGSQDGACAPAAFGPNTIVLGASTYALASPNGELSISSTVRDLTITGAGEKQTTVDAGNLGDRAFEVDAGATVTITDLTITGGDAQAGAVGTSASNAGGPGGSGADGGGILNEGTLTVLDAAITNSQAGAGGAGGSSAGNPPTGPAVAGGSGGPGGRGGGIFNSGALVLTGATLSGDQSGAGGIGGQGGPGSNADPTGGMGGAGGAGGSGGGVANDGGSLTISGSTFNGNTAGAGGAGGLPGGPGGSGDAPIGAVAGSGGSGGTGGTGGALWSTNGDLSVTNSTIASNTAGAGGDGTAGGLGSATSFVSPGNGGDGGSGGNGGAIAADPATLLSSTLAGNRGGAAGAAGAAGLGGGPGAASAGSPGNAGATGGVYGTVAVRDTLLDLNGGNCGPAITSGGDNLSYGDASCPSGFESGDPQLGALQDNGGPTQTIGLQSGSAALGQAAGCPSTDQRGVPRPSTACDIGAYQVAAPVAITGPTVEITATGAEIKATVTPNSGDATVWFQYGKTKVNGSVTAVQHLDGVTAVTVEATLTRLKPDTLYYYRVTATAPDGGASGAQLSFKTTGRPVISGLTIKPSSPKRGATISYEDSGVATTTLTVLRCVTQAGSRCTRYRRVRSFKHTDVAGRNRVHLNARGLAPGAYKLQATARAGRFKGKTVAVTFTVRQ